MLTKLIKWLKLKFGLAAIPDICLASKGSIDYHDYPKDKGGDGIASHFYTYTCWKCGKRFTI